MTAKWFALLAVNLVIGINTRAAEGNDAPSDARAEVEVALTTSTEKRVRPEKPERPERPIKEAPGQEVKELAAEFRSKMAEFHAEQKELVKKLKTASEQERSQIREQLKTNREEFNAMKEEFRDAVKEVTGSLKDHAVKVSAELKVDARTGTRERK